MGDLLFAVVNLIRKNKLDAEMVLTKATEKFISRFHAMERALQEEGKQLGEADLAELDKIWNRVKQLLDAALGEARARGGIADSPHLGLPRASQRALLGSRSANSRHARPWPETRAAHRRHQCIAQRYIPRC